MGYRHSKVASDNGTTVDIRPTQRYKRLFTSAQLPIDSHELPQPFSYVGPSFARENLRSLLLKCGEAIAVRGSSNSGQFKLPKCEESDGEGYTESPWYETPFYRKLRGDKRIPFDPPETEPESTDEDFMNNMMGNYTTGPSSPDTTEVEEFADKYFPSASEEEEEVVAKKKVDEEGKEQEEEEDMFDLNKLLKDDDGSVENEWAKDIEEDMKPSSEPECNFWDLDDEPEEE